MLETKRTSPNAQLSAFMAKYLPEVVATAKATLKKMRTRVPGAVEFVYDNYNGLVIGFGPNERPSDAVLSLVLFPRWVTLCFLQSGPDIPDPQRLLRGSGTRVRHVRLAAAADLDQPAVRALIAEALARADPPIDPSGRRRMIIRSVSAKQRPRRPRRLPEKPAT